MFRCKQFSVKQDKCAMKVNTDSLILGSWAQPKAAKRILDVGTGSGILALMLAQQSAPDSHVFAIELDEAAALQAAENFENSPWRDRLTLKHENLVAYTPDAPFDVIVSNPPYFEPPSQDSRAFETQSSQRFAARQTASLSPDDFFHFCSQFLTPMGSVFCVYPYSSLAFIKAQANRHGLFPVRILDVKHNERREPYLCAIQFKRLPVRDKELNGDVTGKGGLINSTSHDVLVIRDEHNNYTAAYKSLCQPFYLNF